MYNGHDSDRLAFLEPVPPVLLCKDSGMGTKIFVNATTKQELLIYGLVVDNSQL